MLARIRGFRFCIVSRDEGALRDEVVVAISIIGTVAVEEKVVEVELKLDAFKTDTVAGPVMCVLLLTYLEERRLTGAVDWEIWDRRIIG